MGNCFITAHRYTPIISAPAASENGSSSTSSVDLNPFLKIFTLGELKAATNNFGTQNMLGRDEDCLYPMHNFKGWVKGNTFEPSKPGIGMTVTVKRYCPVEGILDQWQSQVELMGKFSHPNLVKLIGFCKEGNRLFLVHEYMQRGSLDNHLFRKSGIPLSWDTRLKIALGVARVLAFLHTREDPIIYYPCKASNVLLDRDYDAKLSCFGLAKLKFEPTEDNAYRIDLFGHAAPEDCTGLGSGSMKLKGDVYCFGMVMLEIITGVRAVDEERLPLGQFRSVDWVKPSLSEKWKVEKIMDPRLGHQYSLEGASQISRLILQCIQETPKHRPSMVEVLEILGNIQRISQV